MSRLSLVPPNFCSCTVTQARNLQDKGKAIDAFCTISMGKEKFVTATREKTHAPDWHEQCDMPIVDDATIKLTVYHKSKNSLSKGDFIGRAYVSLRDLQDYDRVHTNWYPLTNKEGKIDKDRGEIEVSLQFYSKNNKTGSVLDLATKKKHLSLKDIKHSLGDKLKAASKHRKHGGDNSSADQHPRPGDDFLGDSASETTSFGGSHMSLNSMTFNNNVEQQKKKSRAPSSGLGSTMDTGTPYSSRRSVTSDYDTSSILDSASMNGGDETSIPSRFQNQQQHREVYVGDDLPPKKTSTLSAGTRSQNQQQHREVYVGDDLPPKKTSTNKKSKEPSSSITVPTIITTKPTSSPDHMSTNQSQGFSINNDDIDSAINDYKKSTNKSKAHEITSTPDSVFGLSTIKENTKSSNSSKHRDNEEIDFDHYLNDGKKTKKPAPVIQQSKSTSNSKEQKQSTLSHSTDIETPSTSISSKPDNTPSANTTLSATKQSETTSDDSIDEDVDELLGKLERMSSMRSSVKRKIQPRDDIMQQSSFETDNKTSNGYNQSPFLSSGNRNGNTILPDIVGEPTGKNSPQRGTPLNTKKPVNTGLCVLGYENVKSTPVNPKIRQELDYLDREELLHVIAYQSDLLKKRDTRVKDLEHYTDGLLVKIVEQCPAILQVGQRSSSTCFY